MVFTKKMFPHLYEFHKLGQDKTPEGRKFLEMKEEQVNKEYSIVMDLWRDRYMWGGDHKIHEVEKIHI